MKAPRNKISSWQLLALVSTTLTGCSAPHVPSTRVPSVEYTQRLKQQLAQRDPGYRAQLARTEGWQSATTQPALYGSREETRAQLRMVDGYMPENDLATSRPLPIGDTSGATVTNMPEEAGLAAGNYGAYQSANPLTRDYRGPLNLGEPGVSASLWKESRGGNDLFRDYRAYRPMDLITIVVSENTEGKKESDTNVKRESTVAASIENLLGIENWGKINRKTAGAGGAGVDLSNLLNAEWKSDFKGEGDTERKGRLRGKLSAMVVEVLPSGILRIEGEKIISMNTEDETMVISGLVRPEDITSSNEIDSSKIANVRIDYYGKGPIGDAQNPGWLQQFLTGWWPF